MFDSKNCNGLMNPFLLIFRLVLSHCSQWGEQHVRVNSLHVQFLLDSLH